MPVYLTNGKVVLLIPNVFCQT